MELQTKKMVAIVGSRSLNSPEDYQFLNHLFTAWGINAGEDIVLSGGAIGIDMFAKMIATAHQIEVREVLPDYRRFASCVAPLRRNEVIASMCNVMLALWDGRSSGTLHVVEAATALHKPVILYEKVGIKSSPSLYSRRR